MLGGTPVALVVALVLQLFGLWIAVMMDEGTKITINIPIYMQGIREEE